MALAESNTIDAIGICSSTDDLILTLIDELDWSHEFDHLVLLQEKINAYVRFVESGELIESYAKAKGRHVVIEVVSQYPLAAQAEGFFREASGVLRGADIDLRFRVLE